MEQAISGDPFRGRSRAKRLDFVGFITQLAKDSPLLGLFIASILGNVIPFFPVPYLLIVVLLVSTNTGLGLTSLAAIAALGAAIGKFTSYGLGYSARRAFRGTTTRFDSLRRLLGGSVFLAAFLFAALPLPDDIIFVPLGVMRYSPVKTFISLFTGKFVLTLLVAFTAKTSFGALAIASGGSIVVSVVSIGIVVIFGVVMMRVDWEKALQEGWRNTLRGLLRTMARKLGGSRRSSPAEQSS